MYYSATFQFVGPIEFPPTKFLPCHLCYYFYSIHEALSNSERNKKYLIYELTQVDEQLQRELDNIKHIIEMRGIPTSSVHTTATVDKKLS